MSRVPKIRHALAAVAVGLAAVGLAVLPQPAHAAVLFADDFEQPTENVWLAGGSWSVASEDGSKVYRQSSTTGFRYAQAGAGSGSATVVTARVKPTSPLGPANLVAVTGRVSDPNNLYYVAFHGGVLEIGQQAWGQQVPLASTPFVAAIGTWYTLSLSFLVPGTVTGSVSGPAGVAATVSAADPGGTKPGDQVGFWMNSASASFDDIQLSDERPPPPPPTSTPACPVAITFTVGVDYGAAFSTTISFTNLTSTPISPPWTMTWRFTDGQTIEGLFNAAWKMVGPVVTIQSLSWYPAVAPDALSSPTIGFLATGPGSGHPPADVTFNGAACPISFS